MGKVDNPDILVIIADFFMRLAEATQCVVPGVYNNKLIVIFRSATFWGDAGNTAQKLFGQLGGSAGGHKGAARVEIPLSMIRSEIESRSDLAHFVRKRLKETM
jgi:nanoRNase/pAp phosphatase (c-di-AMP/oligoRNAs hydrolase)